ncbi:MAG: hypothetical protein ABFS86_16165 [Planctomycetota bacterium]
MTPTFRERASRRRRNAWIARGVIVAVAAVLFFTGFHFFDEATRKPLTEQQKIRLAVEDYLRACRDRDYDEVFELQSANSRIRMGSPPPGSPCDIPPADPAKWFPWDLPVEALDRLMILSVDRTEDATALVELRPDGDGHIGSRRVRMEFMMEPEGDEWRIDTCSLYLREQLLAPPPPPAEEDGKLPDGRRFLALGFPGKPTTDLLRKVPVLILRVDRDTAWGDLLPLLAGAAVRDVEEIRIRPERRMAAERGAWVMFSGFDASVVTSGDHDLADIVYPLPIRPETVDLVIGIGRRADVSERAGALPFESVIGPESSKALARFTNLLEKPLEELSLMLSVHPTTDIARLANVWHGLRERGAKGIVLATENPLGAGYGSALLLNGLRPDQIERVTQETLPKVWPDNPVLQRTINRRR